MPHPIDLHVGQYIRLRRMSLGMSQQELARELGITFQQVQKYEHGTNRVSASRLYEIATLLDTDVGGFFPPNKELGQGDVCHEETWPFLTTREAVKMLTAFSRIENAKIRSSILGLTESVTRERKTEQD